MRIQNWRATAVSRKQNCILRGLGRSINKQKPGISVRVEMPGFVGLLNNPNRKSQTLSRNGKGLLFLTYQGCG